MKAKEVSTAFTTDKVEESRDFYVRYLGARVTFDCGWYVNLELGSEKQTLQFMSPREGQSKPSSPAGLMYNFEVEDVDKEYERLVGMGIEAVMPLEDHPWGDRGFAIQDPNGITLYLWTFREPSEEFKQDYK